MKTKAKTPKELGELIRYHRTEQNLTQTVLADKAGTRQRQISLIETGSDSLRIDTICNVLAALNLELKVEPVNLQPSLKVEDIF